MPAGSGLVPESPVYSVTVPLVVMRADAIEAGFGEPERAVRPGRDSIGARAGRDAAGIFGHPTTGRDATNAIGGGLP